MTEADAEAIEEEAEEQLDALEDAEPVGADDGDGDGDGNQPDLEEEDFADVDLEDVADEIEEEAGADSDLDPEETEAEEDAQDDAGDGTDVGSGSWGEMYVGTLTSLSNAVIEEHGKPGAEPIDEEKARDLKLDQHFNAWMKEQGMGEQMPPGQALVVSTSAFLVMVMATKTDLASDLMEEIDV